MGTLANNVDLDQMLQNAVSDLGLDCLLLNTGISIKHGYNKNSLDTFLLKMDQSKELRWKNPFSVNGLSSVNLQSVCH